MFIVIVRVENDGGAYEGGGRRIAARESLREIAATADGGVANVHDWAISATTNLPAMCARPLCQLLCFIPGPLQKLVFMFNTHHVF